MFSSSHDPGFRTCFILQTPPWRSALTLSSKALGITEPAEQQLSPWHWYNWTFQAFWTEFCFPLTPVLAAAASSTTQDAGQRLSLDTGNRCELMHAWWLFGGNLCINQQRPYSGFPFRYKSTNVALWALAGWLWCWVYNALRDTGMTGEEGSIQYTTKGGLFSDPITVKRFFVGVDL